MMEKLKAESHRFSFYQLVRLLLRQEENVTPPGGEGSPEREIVRFRPSTGLGFPSRSIEDVEVVEPRKSRVGRRYVVTVNFLGLYGPSSPMPTHITEDIIHGGDDAQCLRDFLDIFNHRMISFVFRAWAKYRYEVVFDPEGRDEITERMLCLLGLGTSGLTKTLGFPPLLLLRTAGLLNTLPRSASSLEGFLRAIFGVPVAVEQCIEREVRIPDEQRTRLGTAASRLGESICLGEKARDRMGGFRVVIGPLDREAYRRFLPDERVLGKLVKLVRLFVSDPLDFDVELVLRREDVPPLKLSAEADQPLGQMTWIRPTGGDDGRSVLSVIELDPYGGGREPEESGAVGALAGG